MAGGPQGREARLGEEGSAAAGGRWRPGEPREARRVLTDRRAEAGGEGDTGGEGEAERFL